MERYRERRSTRRDGGDTSEERGGGPYLEHSGVSERLGFQQECQVLHNLCQLTIHSLHISAGNVATSMTPLLPWKTSPLYTHMHTYTIVKHKMAGEL